MAKRCKYLIQFESPTTLDQWCSQPNPDENVHQKCQFGEEVKCPLMIHRISVEDKKGVRLADLDQKDSATVMDIKAEKMATQRVMDMGLCIGTTFRVLSKLHRGPIEVSVRDTNLVIGYDLAKKIVVERHG